MGSSSRPWAPLVCRGVRPRRRSAANRFVAASERAEGPAGQKSMPRANQPTGVGVADVAGSTLVTSTRYFVRAPELASTGLHSAGRCLQGNDTGWTKLKCAGSRAVDAPRLRHFRSGQSGASTSAAYGHSVCQWPAIGLSGKSARWHGIRRRRGTSTTAASAKYPRRPLPGCLGVWALDPAWWLCDGAACGQPATGNPASFTIPA
jgi:hypothetical protein